MKRIYVWDSDGDIGAYATKELAMQAFETYYLNYRFKEGEEKEKEEARQQMEEEGYYYDEQIYPVNFYED
jgi:hypothetical protein